ncbi:hypothetical protein ACQCSU_08615 [Pseudarthrobacter sp. O4]
MGTATMTRIVTGGTTEPVAGVRAVEDGLSTRNPGRPTVVI